MDSRLPFADAEGSDERDFDEDLNEEDVGDYDATDNGDLDEFDEDEDEFEDIDKSLSRRISKAIQRSMDEGVVPKRQYLKAISQDQYNKIIGKDAYGFLHGHEDEVIEVLSVGKEVSDYFKTITPIDVREVYWIIITNLEQMGWSAKTMVEELMQKFPTLKQYEAERIIQTETTRVINYCKEFIAERGDYGEYNYGWIGPLDSRTTPMCYYLQTGELRESDKKLLEKAGHTIEDLPPIPEDGMPLEQLKETCRVVASAFGYDMISDWVMHINCRHTFARGNKRLDLEFSDEGEIDRIVEDLIHLPGGEGSEPTHLEIQPVTEDDKMYIPVYDGFESTVFINSIYDMPTMYDNPDSDSVFIFEEMNEEEVASWARMVIQLRNDGLSDEVIVWAIEDMGNIEDDTIAYIVSNADDLLERAYSEGWF